MLFPVRASDLGPGEFIYTGQHIAGKQANAIDFHVRRWEPDLDDWVRYEETASSPTPPADEYLAFGLPVYAPEDGYVVACFRNYVDDPDLDNLTCDGVSPNPPCPDSVFPGGNFIVVQSWDNDYAYVLAHLEYDSIPPELCPITDTTTSNVTANDCNLGGDFGTESIPENTQIKDTNVEDPFGYPIVLRGDRLGNIGLTGSVSSVHSHFEVFEIGWDSNDRFCKGPSQPMEFYETWYQDVLDSPATTNWTSMAGDTTLDVGPPVLIYPGALGAPRDDHDYNLDASKLHFVTHSSGGVMAYLDGAGQLDIRSYDIDSNGDVNVESLVNEGTVNDLSIAQFNTTRSVIVSIRGGNDNLKLIPYEVDTNGVITRQVGKEVTEDDIGMVASVKSPLHTGIVVAVENDLGTLEVIDYDIDSSFNITRNNGTGTGGGIDAVEITALGGDFDGVATAELIAGSSSLRLRSFEVPASGGVTNADTLTVLLAGTDIDIDTVWTALDQYVVTNLRQNDGTMRLDVWDLDAQGDISLISTASAGSASQIDGTSAGVGDYLTSVRDSNGRLRLIGWSIDDFGEIRRTATEVYDFVADAVSINSAAEPGHIETLYTDSDGELRLLTVEENFYSGI